MLNPNFNLHFHQCGRIRDGWIEDYGCGYLWQHAFKTNLSMVENHLCPKCNHGPWYYELSIEEVENARIERIILAI